MAEKTHQREKSILDGFETITDVIHSAMSKGISFYDEPEMHASCQELQDSIIKGVADLIWILKGEAKGEYLGSFVRQGLKMGSCPSTMADWDRNKNQLVFTTTAQQRQANKTKA